MNTEISSGSWKWPFPFLY